DLEPLAGTTVPQGGQLDYRVSIGSATPGSQATIWLSVNNTFNVLGPILLPIPASTFRDRFVGVGGGVTPGGYTLNGAIFDIPSWTIYDTDLFAFTVIPGDASGTDWFSGGGESFEIETTEILPEVYNLSQNYPNPFNPTTNIIFALPEAGKVTLSVYNVNGQLVANLVNGYREAGNHVVTFDATGMTSGVYFYQITVGDYTAIQKMTLVK
ncbi:MAG: T9SS type A sorting domain-containing protein, partial [bacterium]